MNIILQFVLAIIPLLQTASGQNYGDQSSGDTKLKGPNPLRYFSPPEVRLKPGWYSSNKEYIKDKNKVFLFDCFMDK